MRRAIITILLSSSVLSVWSQTLSVYKSEMDVLGTTNKIEEVIKSYELIFFETVAHDLIAAERGVELGLTREILFEDPDLTTSLIKCQATTALDLPLKILVWEENEDVYVGFIDPKFMKKRFMLSGCEDTVDDMGKLLVKVVVDSMRAIREKD